MSETIYAIGDIHGHFDQLETALLRIEKDGNASGKIVFLGDYIDRGPESARVLSTLIEAQSNGAPWIFLKGNHDAYLPQFVQGGDLYGSKTRPELSWFNPVLGGAATLQSYGVEASDQHLERTLVEARAHVPEAHIAFIEGLSVSHETEEFFFAHAGIRPGVAFSEQSPTDLMWIRQEFLNDTRDHGRLVVHGHTAIQSPRLYQNRLNLDGGAGWGRPLFPVVLEGGEVFLLTEKGRERLEAVD